MILNVKVINNNNNNDNNNNNNFMFRKGTFTNNDAVVRAMGSQKD